MKLSKRIFALLIAILILVPFAMTAGAFNYPTKFTVAKLDTAPTFDGKVSAEEWGSPIMTWDGSAEPAFTDLEVDKNWLYIKYGDSAPVIENVKKAKIDLYARWDDKNLYLAAVESIPNFAQTFLYAEMYKDYCLQIQFASGAPKANLTMYEFGFSIDAKGNTMATRWSPFAKEVNSDVKVGKEGDVVTYEICLPWEDLGVKEGIAEGYNFGITYGFTIGNKAAPFAAIQFGKSLLNKASADTVLSTLVASNAQAPAETEAGTPSTPEATATETPTPTATETPTATPTETPAATNDDATTTPETASGSNAWIYVVIVIIIVAGAVGAYFYFGKKKK